MKNHSIRRSVVEYTSAVVLGASLLLVQGGVVCAGEAWEAKFEEVCSKVDLSQTLSEKEMQSLIQLADKITPEIEASNHPKKKVYLRRLKNCKSMYEFVIETKKK